MKKMNKKLGIFLAVLTGVLVIAVAILWVLNSPQGIQEESPNSSQEMEQEVEPTPTPIPTPEPTPEPIDYELTLMMVGDNLLHMGIINTGLQEDGSYNYDMLFTGIQDYLDIADIKMINQETIFGGNDRGFSGYPAFNSPTEVGDAMVKAGFNVVFHSSNHTGDKGQSGIKNCLEFWEQYPEVKVVGMHQRPEATPEPTPEVTEAPAAEAGDAISTETTVDTTVETEVETSAEISAEVESEGTPEVEVEEEKEAPVSLVLMEVKDVTFALLNYTYGPNLATFPTVYEGFMDMLCYYDPETRYIDFTRINPQVLEDIAYAETVADFVIVAPHWGTEYTTTPTTYQKQMAKQMVEAGADLLLGTHPHVVEPMEWVEADNGNRGLCYYSLGNYVSTQQNPLTMLEAMAWVTFHVTDEGVSIMEEKTGVLPLVNHYSCPPVRFEKVYHLEDYTEELAEQHGIFNYGGRKLVYSDLLRWTDEVFGDNVLTRAQILGIEEPVEEVVPEVSPEPTNEQGTEITEETAEVDDAA